MTEDELIDQELDKIERKMAKIYRQAQKDLKKDIEAYFESFKKADNEKKKELEAGEITKEEYKQWRLSEMTSGYEFNRLRDRIAERYLQANKDTAQLRNDSMKDIYAFGHNYSAYEIESRIND